MLPRQTPFLGTETSTGSLCSSQLEADKFADGWDSSLDLRIKDRVGGGQTMEPQLVYLFWNIDNTSSGLPPNTHTQTQGI